MSSISGSAPSRDQHQRNLAANRILQLYISARLLSTMLGALTSLRELRQILECYLETLSVPLELALLVSYRPGMS